MSVMQETAVKHATARHLLSKKEFEAVTLTVMNNNEDMEPLVAERITDEALKFIVACVESPKEPLRPSRIVDEGWHALILHTRIYQHLCQRLGLFVHHVPETGDVARHNPEALARAQAAIGRAGYSADPMLWVGPADNTISVAADCEHSEPAPMGCGADCSNTGPN
ncbi:glycine-rich domain-containing protein [Streptomyces atratus]|uniref:glycine-rich domain-containing protein n=1 Tax=Streptomyces atratus TaxID=1893 RepID=UPI00365D4A6D